MHYALMYFSSQNVLFQLDLGSWLSLQGNCTWYTGIALWLLNSDFLPFLQKLPSSVFCNGGCSWRFDGFRGKTLVLRSLFNKAAGLRACGFPVLFLCDLQTLWEHLTWRASANSSFCFSKFWHITYLIYLTYYIDVSFYIQFLF